MILTTSYLFDHVSPDGLTVFVTPYSPEVNRDPTHLVPIAVSDIAYSVPTERGGVALYYLGRASDSSFTTFKVTLDPTSEPLPRALAHLSAAHAFTASSSIPRTVDIVSNPCSGHGYSNALLADVVRPLLKPFEDRGALRVRECATGTELATEAPTSDKTVVVLGGDGTIHQVVNRAIPHGEAPQPGSQLHLVLIPTGTANALYYHLFPPECPEFPTAVPLAPFYSLVAFLRDAAPTPTPLPLALNTISRPAGSTLSPVAPTITSVVTSAALHACLLHDAERLRETVPGVERFKVAAQANVETWWHGTLALSTRRGGAARRYDSTTRSFRVAPPSARSETTTTTTIEIEGPFAYWISSLTSRFEPTFVVCPLRSHRRRRRRSVPLPPDATAASSDPPDNDDDDEDDEGATIDLVLIRPLRHRPTQAACDDDDDRSGRRGPDAARRAFADQVWHVTRAMYDQGKHVDLAYPEGDGIDDDRRRPETETEGEDARCGEERRHGRTEIVEYWRTDEFRWTPVRSNELKSNLVCLDGALHDLGEGGSLVTRVLDTRETGVRVWS